MYKAVVPDVYLGTNIFDLAAFWLMFNYLQIVLSI
jgi:hypothetical protein